MDVLVDDLEVLRASVEVSLGTGVRKITELLELRIENVNCTGLATFRRANGRDVEVRPNWFLLTDTKGKKPHRLIPMNAPVREVLLGVIQNRETGLVRQRIPIFCKASRLSGQLDRTPQLSASHVLHGQCACCWAQLAREDLEK